MTEKDDDALIKAIDKFTKQAMVSQQGRMQRNPGALLIRDKLS